MLTDILQNERDETAAKLIGLCAVFTSTIEAARALEAGDAVAIVPDPAITLETTQAVTVDVEIYLVHPSTDEQAARKLFDEALQALWPFNQATPQMLDIGDTQLFAYRVTNQITYQI